MGRAWHRGPSFPVGQGTGHSPGIQAQAWRDLHPSLSSALCRMAADSGRAWDAAQCSSKSLLLKFLLVPGGLGMGVARHSGVLERGTRYKIAALFCHSEAWLSLCR